MARSRRRRTSPVIDSDLSPAISFAVPVGVADDFPA